MPYVHLKAMLDVATVVNVDTANPGKEATVAVAPKSLHGVSSPAELRAFAYAVYVVFGVKETKPVDTVTAQSLTLKAPIWVAPQT